jgi:stage II sporulation protein AA (anti-sigma F factor antagonist)
MATTTADPLLEVEQVGEVTVVKLTQAKILDEEATQEIARLLLGMVTDLGHRNLVLNFDRVERLTSVLLGKLVLLHRKAEEAGGQLMLCHIQPRVYEIFELLRLPYVLNICDDEQQALQAF